MPRTEVYQLRLTPQEKAKLAQDAAPDSIAAFVRKRCGIGKGERVAVEWKADTPLPASPDPDDIDFTRLVAKHSLRTSKANAERLARKEQLVQEADHQGSHFQVSQIRRG